MTDRDTGLQRAVRWRYGKANSNINSLRPILRTGVRLLMVLLQQRNCWASCRHIRVERNMFVTIQNQGTFFFVAATWEKEADWFHLNTQLYKIKVDSRYRIIFNNSRKPELCRV